MKPHQENGTNTLKNTETTSGGTGDSVPVRKKTLKKVVAGAAGLALASAGFAAVSTPGTSLSGWEGSQPGTDAMINAGELTLALGTDHGWFDTTGLPSNQPATAIDPASYAITPGDRLERVQEISLKLSGDNIAAELTANIKSIKGPLASQGLTGTVRLVKGSYTPTSGLPPADVVATTPIIDSPKAPQFTFNSAVTAADGRYTVLTDLVFNQGSVLGQSATGILDSTSFNLKQVRKGQPKPWAIPDSFLAWYVSDKLGVPQNELSQDDALQLTTLDLTGWFNVASLEGMQYATNLTSVNISHTQISSVAPLAGANKLTDFTAKSVSNLTSIDPLAGLKLVNVNFQWTQLESISALSTMDTLQNVDLLGVLGLSDINALAGKPSLAKLSIRLTATHSLEPLRYNASLVYLDALQIPATDWSPVGHVTTLLR